MMLSFMLLLVCLAQARDLMADKPRLKDWFEATWFDGKAKIPLSIDANAMWYASLSVANVNTGNWQYGGKCVMDNNSIGTLIFSSGATGVHDHDWFFTWNSDCDTTKDTYVTEEGYEFVA